MNIYRIFLIALCNVTCLRASRVIVVASGLRTRRGQFHRPFDRIICCSRHCSRLCRTHFRSPRRAVADADRFDRPRAGARAAVRFSRAARAFRFGGAVRHVVHFLPCGGAEPLGAISGEADRTRNFNNYTLMISLGGFVGPLSPAFRSTTPATGRPTCSLRWSRWCRVHAGACGGGPQLTAPGRQTRGAQPTRRAHKLCAAGAVAAGHSSAARRC